MEILAERENSEMEIREITEIREMADLREIAMNVVSGATERTSVREKVVIITTEMTGGVITVEVGNGK